MGRYYKSQPNLKPTPTQAPDDNNSVLSEFDRHQLMLLSVLRSKGLKDATCVGWFGDDWDFSVGCPPEAMIT